MIATTSWRSWSALTVSLVLFFCGCVEVNEPEAPDIIIPENTGECSTFCECDAADVQGRVFRLTRMEIDEPEEFAQMLNSMWESDVKNNTLNVIFEVTEAIQGTSSAFDNLGITVGPGWRDPKEPYALKPEEGASSESEVESYCILEGLSADITLKPYHGYQCQFKSEEDSNLYFHSGPKDAPLVCAPDISPRNNIPIRNLKIRTGLSEDCTSISNGTLEGCITADDGNHICMCAITGTCDVPPEDPDVSFDEDELNQYCKGACGKGWISFGEIVKSFGLAKTCLTPEGKPGYRLQGFFDAVEITDKFNPIKSIDCSEY